MRLSSGFVAPSVIAILSTALLSSLSGTAMSQTATGSGTQLPNITVEAPSNGKAATAGGNATRVRFGWHTERAGHRDPLKRRLGRRRLGRRRLRGVLSWRSLPGSRERPAVATMVAIKLQTRQGPLGRMQRIGGFITQFSQQPAKTHSLTGNYAQCVETKMFLGWDRQRSWWYCTGMLAGGNFGSPQRIETGSARVSRLIADS